MSLDYDSLYPSLPSILDGLTKERQKLNIELRKQDIRSILIDLLKQRKDAKNELSDVLGSSVEFVDELNRMKNIIFRKGENNREFFDEISKEKWSITNCKDTIAFISPTDEIFASPVFVRNGSIIQFHSFSGDFLIVESKYLSGFKIKIQTKQD